MSSIMEALASQLADGNLSQISRQLGADEETTGRAISGALPMLFGALARNSQQEEGASALASALDRDHDGGLLDDLAGFLGTGNSSRAGNGAGILGHVLGGRRGAVEASVSRASGLDSQPTAQLLAMLAPLVMGALGKAKRQQGLDIGGVSSMLREEQQRAVRERPEMDMLSGLLDRDGDGNVLDDVAKAGAGILGRFLRS